MGGSSGSAPLAGHPLPPFSPMPEKQPPRGLPDLTPTLHSQRPHSSPHSAHGHLHTPGKGTDQDQGQHPWALPENAERAGHQPGLPLCPSWLLDFSAREDHPTASFSGLEMGVHRALSKHVINNSDYYYPATKQIPRKHKLCGHSRDPRTIPGHNLITRVQSVLKAGPQGRKVTLREGKPPQVGSSGAGKRGLGGAGAVCATWRADPP